MLNQAVPSEKELLLKVACGDEHAFSQLFNAHHQLLGEHIFRITDSVELAEEVVQDVFLKIWMSRETLNTVQNFGAYLFVISKNHALNCLRKVAKDRARQKALEDNAVTVIAHDDNTNLDGYYTLLDQAIDHLPPQQQKVYLLSRHNRLKYDEIAHEMGLSRETVKKISARGNTLYYQFCTVEYGHFGNGSIDIFSFLKKFKK